jgi:hypothetical protein
VDQATIIALLQRLGLLPRLVECVRCGFDDFDNHVAPAVRSSVEDARPKFVNLRILERLRLAFGGSGQTRVVRSCDLDFLLVEGTTFDVGVRAKKLNEECLSYNHCSGQQDRLRQAERFFNLERPTAHIFLGYRMRGGLEPALTNVSLSSEHQDCDGVRRLSWIFPLWNEAEGLPLIQPIQPDMFPPPAPPRIVPKLPKPEVGDGTGEQGG